MGTAIGIALFLAVYGRIGFMVYEELTGRQRSRVKPPRARRLLVRPLRARRAHQN